MKTALINYRKRSKGIWLVTFLAALFWGMMLFSCSPSEILTSEHGRVIHYDANSVTVEFDTYKKKKHKGIYKYAPTDKRAVNAFYLPAGHEFKLGDIY